MASSELSNRAAGSVVSVENVTHRYGKTIALDGISVEIPSGIMVGIVGPDGVGKSTLMALIAGSKKLVKLAVDLGTETRQVVAGIAESYAPESLVGKTIVLVANLKPAKLMGVESNGMVLAGTVDGRAVLCSFDGDVAPGTKVK